MRAGSTRECSRRVVVRRPADGLDRGQGALAGHRHLGLFITGVLSTGIYCLPSCPARKPKAENVVFFAVELGEDIKGGLGLEAAA